MLVFSKEALLFLIYLLADKANYVHRIFRSPDFYFKSIFASIPNHKQIIYQLIRHTRNDLTTKSTWKERQLSRSNTY